MPRDNKHTWCGPCALEGEPVLQEEVGEDVLLEDGADVRYESRKLAFQRKDRDAVCASVLRDTRVEEVAVADGPEHDAGREGVAGGVQSKLERLGLIRGRANAAEPGGGDTRQVVESAALRECNDVQQQPQQEQ